MREEINMTEKVEQVIDQERQARDLDCDHLEDEDGNCKYCGEDWNSNHYCTEEFEEIVKRTWSSAEEYASIFQRRHIEFSGEDATVTIWEIANHYVVRCNDASDINMNIYWSRGDAISEYEADIEFYVSHQE